MKKMKYWDSNKQPALDKVAHIIGLLENLKTKLPSKERKKIDNLLRQIQPRQYLVIKQNLSNITKNMVWDFYTELNTVNTLISQLNKDSKWD